MRALPFLLLLAIGCAGPRAVPPLRPSPIGPEYRIGCPDVIEINFSSSPSRDAAVSVDIDGRVPIPDAGRPRVEGLTAAEAADSIALAAELPPGSVQVTVLEPRAAKVFVSGPDNARRRAIAYTGPEPVLDVLRREKLIPPVESKLNRVYVLRSNIAAGTPPRLYHVDVEAVLLDNQNTTNMLLQPGDHIYIGESRLSSISRLLPDWARPLYRKLVGLLPEALK